MNYIQTKGNLLEQTEGILVHGVNCQGVMGGGIAAQIRQQFPQVYKDYLEVYSCQGQRHVADKTKQTLLGKVVYTQITPTLIIASAFTQLDFGRDPNRVYVDYAAVEKCFTTIAHNQQVERSFGSPRLTVKFPSIGAGLANGDWLVIENILKTICHDTCVDFQHFIY